MDGGFGTDDPNIEFRHAQFRTKLIGVNVLCYNLANLHLNYARGVFRCNINQTRVLTISSMYKSLDMSL
jgi:hypothetical protein